MSKSSHNPTPSQHLALDQEPRLPQTLTDARRNHGGLTVPDDFFVQFERKMNAVIDAEAATHQPTVGASPAVQQGAAVLHPRRWVGIAAAVACIVGLGLIMRLAPQAEPPVPGDVEHIATMATLRSTDAVSDIELPEQMADELVAAASDYDVFSLYCDL